MTIIKNAGFVGLGNIGKPMANALLKGDFGTWVYDVFPQAAEELVAAGAKLATNIAELAEHCQVIGLCVRNDDDVIDVMDKILAAPGQCQVVAIHSTVKPETIHAQALRAQAANIALIDAPITGGASGAANASLCYIVGGDDKALELCRPVFATSAKEIIHAGGLGMGMTAKLCNNLMTYAEFVAIYEAMQLAEASGLDKEVVKKVGAANGNITEQMAMFILLRDFKPGMPAADFEKMAGGFADVAEKDLSITLQQAKQLKRPLPGCEQSLALIKDVYFDNYS